MVEDTGRVRGMTSVNTLAAPTSHSIKLPEQSVDQQDISSQTTSFLITLLRGQLCLLAVCLITSSGHCRALSASWPLTGPGSVHCRVCETDGGRLLGPQGQSSEGGGWGKGAGASGGGNLIVSS